MLVFRLDVQLVTFIIIMDKIAANNHFVAMRKEIKKAKAMVSGNLIRKINKLKQEKDKLEDELQKSKIDDKVDRILNEIKLLKIIDSYEISKHATVRPDPKEWNKVINDSKATPEQILEARIITKNNVQKCIMKFRSDCIDCDEWLNEYIEYREKKRDLTKVTKPFKRKDKRSENDKRDKPRINNKKDNFSDRFSKKSRDFNKHESKGKKEQVKFEDKSDKLHPSWEIKKKEKERLKAALSDTSKQSRKIIFQ